MQASTPHYAAAIALLLPFLASCASTQPPPLPIAIEGTQEEGQLEIRLFAVNDLQAFRRQRQASDHEPEVQNETVVIQGGTVHLPILFNGCGADEENGCEIYGRLTITDVETEEIVYQGNPVKLWSKPHRAETGVWNMATHVPNVTVLEGGNPMRIEFEVSDEGWHESAHAGLTLTTTGTVNEAK